MKLHKKFGLMIILISLISTFLYAEIIYEGDEYTETMMPYYYKGSNETFIVVSGTISTFDDSRMSVFEINGINMIGSSTLPSPEDGKKYFIHFKGRNKNATFNLAGTNDWSETSMTVTPTILTGFTAEPNTPSLEQNITVSGQDLSADITLSAPTNYEISINSGSGFASSLILMQSNGTVAQTTVYVRLKSGLSAGPYNGEVITISSLGIDDQTVTCNGVVQIPNPSIDVSPTNLSGFVAEPDAASSEQIFTVSGEDLTADINISAPTNYEISITSGSGFASLLVLTQSNGSVALTTVYVRLKSGLSVGSYDGEDITISSSGINDQIVRCNGDVIENPSPSINVNPATLSGFNYINDNGPSSEYSFTISGQYLEADISLTAPMNYEISTTSGSGFGSSIILAHSGSIVNATTIYVRLKSGLSTGSYNGENITISTSGTSDQTVTCSGEVQDPDPIVTLSLTTLTGFITSPATASPEQSFTVNGHDLLDNIIISAPTNYEISTTSGIGFGSSLVLVQSAGVVNMTTIYIRLKSGLSIGSYNGENITISTNGMSNQTVTCSGEVQNQTVINWNGIDYTFIAMPYSYDGGSDLHIYTYGKITSFTTNNKISSLEINGQTFETNQTHTDPPPSIDQKYFISISPKNSRGHFEIDGMTMHINYSLNIKIKLEGALASR